MIAISPRSPWLARCAAFLVPSCALAAPLLAAAWWAEGRFSIAATLTILLLVGTIALTGRLVRQACRLRFGDDPFAADVLLGYALVSVALLFGTLILRQNTGTVLIGIALLDLVALVVWRRHWMAVAEHSATAASSASLFLIAALSCVWSQAAISAVSGLDQTGQFPAWRDFFIHAGTIVQFSQFDVLHGTSIFLADAKMPLYHFGSYMLPAALHGLSGMPAITVATAFFVPLGFLCMGLGSLVLGTALAGRLGGIAAVIAVLMIPDPSHYGLRCAWFGFHWMQQVTPTSPYAVGIALLAIASLVRASRDSDDRPLWVAGLLALSCLFFRAHVFVVMGLVGALVFAARAWSRGGLLGYGAIAMMGAGILIVAYAAERSPAAPHFYSGTFTPIDNLKFLLSESVVAKAAAGLARLPGALQIFVLASLASIGLGGIYVFVYAAGLIVLGRASLLRRHDVIPLVVALAYMAVVVGFPLTNTPDPRELQQRPFVLVYAVLAIWSGTMIVRWAATLHLRKKTATLAATACLALLYVPFRYAPQVQFGTLSWAPQFIPFAVPLPLVAAARSIRDRAPADSTVWGTEVDDWAVIVGLSERRAFTSLSAKTGGAIFLPGASASLLREREAMRPQFTSITSEQDLMTAARSAGITHYIVAPGQPLAAGVSSGPVGGYRLLSIPRGRRDD